MTAKPSRCTVCGDPISQGRTGRPGKFCPPCGEEVQQAQKATWTRLYRRTNSPPTPRSLKTNTQTLKGGA